jgi:hypothetical protein
MGTRMALPHDSPESFEVTDEDRDRARKITQQVGEALTRAIKNGHHTETRSRLLQITNRPLDDAQARDVASSLAIASQDLARYSAIGSAPAIRTDERSIPVSISAFAGNVDGAKGYIDASFNEPSRMNDTMLRWRDQSPSRTILGIGDATSLVLGNLYDFLGVRIAGIRHWIATKIDDKVGHVSPASGDEADQPMYSANGEGLFRVTVDCTKTNCRIFVSPAYFVNWLYFGYPSTPVVGHLMSGRYIFGTDSVAPPVTEDSAIFQIPNSFHPVLKRF